jgi:predicted RNA-binding protein with RPS1 domain
VEILPGLDGLVHISELAPGRVRETTDVVKMGDKVKVKISPSTSHRKVKLSRRRSRPEAAAGSKARPQRAAAGRRGWQGGRADSAASETRDRRRSQPAPARTRGLAARRRRFRRG